jgi:hypothetical protein
MTPRDQNRVLFFFFFLHINNTENPERVQKRRRKMGVPRELKKEEKKGGSSRERAARTYMQGNTQNIPIVNMYLAVLRTQRVLIDPQFAASSQGMHGQTPPLKRGAQRCNRPGARTF